VHFLTRAERKSESLLVRGSVPRYIAAQKNLALSQSSTCGNASLPESAANGRDGLYIRRLTRSAGMGRADGRGVLMGCHEPLAGGVGAVHSIGGVWFGAHRACRRAFRDAQVCCWWAGGQRRLSHACHKWCETGWDGGRYIETISAGRREGRDGLGRMNTG
jgi:hypothetical protein